MFFTKLIQFHSRFYQWLLPPVCALCGNLTQRAYNICRACQEDLPILSHSCRQCAQFLPGMTNSTSLCGACLSKPPPFDHTFALFPYQPPIVQLIIQLKFQHQLSVAQALGELLIDRIRYQWYWNKPLPDLILPIPLHDQRLRERGFNQALEIARPVANALALPIDTHGIQRIKATLAQSGLSAAERKQNIAHAFTALRTYQGLTVAVIDDVITTGHTMTECCQLLKQQGAVRIDVWCCARRDIAINAKTR